MMSANSEPLTRPGRRRLLAAAVLLSLGVAGPALARPYEGYEFADSLQLGGSTLVLNGLGMRAVATIRGYLAGLYLVRKASVPAEVFATPGPKRIQMRILLDASMEEFVKAVNKGVQRNCTESERAALTEELPAFVALLRGVGQVHKQDLIDIDYLPGKGTALVINGKQAGATIAGAELYDALLKVFLGERPTDKRLKAGLLGLPTG